MKHRNKRNEGNKRNTSFLDLLPVISFVVFFLGTCVVMAMGFQESRRHERFFKEMAQVIVIPPKDVPLATTENIEIAEVLFGIQRNMNVTSVSLSATIEDRGLTTGGLFDPAKAVLIGPAAFTSWAVLGSTLGHEIEIHCKQSFLAILVKDRFLNLQLSARNQIVKMIPFLRQKANHLNFDAGTWAAEREAYDFELQSARRFGLSKDEVKAIHQVVNFYYPNDTNDHVQP